MRGMSLNSIVTNYNNLLKETNQLFEENKILVKENKILVKENYSLKIYIKILIILSLLKILWILNF